MKRLKLDDFKAKNLKKNNAQQIDQLLGQVLGDCHDSGTSSNGSGIHKFSNVTIKR
ncbi:MAG: hypothetical protein ACRBFS_06630 [Aureispira sp.]